MRSCSVCGKGRRVGNKVSHANNKTKKVWEPNLKRIHALVDGRTTHVYACTRCIRAGRVTKAPVRKPVAAPAAS